MNIALVSTAQLAVAQIARARGLERVPTTRAENVRDVLDALPVPVVFLLSAPVAVLVGATPAKWVWASVIVIGPLTARMLRRS